MVYTYVVRSSLLNSYSLVLATTVGANRVLEELLAWIRLTTLIDWSTFTTFSEMSWYMLLKLKRDIGRLSFCRLRLYLTYVGWVNIVEREYNLRLKIDH